MNNSLQERWPVSGPEKQRKQSNTQLLTSNTFHTHFLVYPLSYPTPKASEIYMTSIWVIFRGSMCSRAE